MIMATKRKKRNEPRQKKTHAGFKAKSDSMSAKTKRASGYTLDEWEKRNKKKKDPSGIKGFDFNMESARGI